MSCVVLLYSSIHLWEYLVYHYYLAVEICFEIVFIMWFSLYLNVLCCYHNFFMVRFNLNLSYRFLLDFFSLLFSIFIGLAVFN